MNIGFDAKRAFHNDTGLGVFSRVLISLLAAHYPDNEYYLFNPKKGKLFTPQYSNVQEVLPKEFLHKILKSAWRSKWLTKDLQKLKIDLFHGLSHEIPFGIRETRIPAVVTMHDMFPEIYPHQFKPVDVKIYRRKSRHACKKADRIMAISRETKKHIVDIYQIDPDKIDVIYQSCDPAFSVIQPEAEKEAVRKKYGLPEKFFLHVGAIIERKNLLNICKAMQLIRHEIDLPLVVVGKGKAYKEQVKQYIKEQHLQDRVIFLSDNLAAAGKKPFVATADFPAIYQLATAMIYPSFYEGFGIPVAEALCSGVPVITSNTSCLPEAGGPGSYYVDPSKPEEMAEGFRKIYADAAYAEHMKQLGWEHAKNFAPEVYVKRVMNMYLSVLAAVS